MTRIAAEAATPTSSLDAPKPAPVLQELHFTWIDAAKGFGIVLVVVGHAIRGLVKSDIMAWTPTTRFVDAWIYAFHMPLFFLLSGLFLFRSMEKLWREFVWEKIASIAYPYFVWSLITLAIKDVFGDLTNQSYDIADFTLILYQPIDQFWFLYVLFVLVLAGAALLKIGLSPWGGLVLAVVFYPSVIPSLLYAKGVPFQLGAMAIYVAIGVVFGNERNLQKVSSIQARWLVTAVVLGGVFSSLAGWFDHSHRIAVQPALAICGIVAVIALALLIDKSKFSAALQFLGRYSLEIYVLHTIASAGVRIVLINFADIADPSVHLVLGVVAGLCLPVIAALFFERIGFQYAFTLRGRHGSFGQGKPPHSSSKRS